MIVLKSTTDDLKVILTSIWVVFDTIMLEKEFWSLLLWSIIRCALLLFLNKQHSDYVQFFLSFIWKCVLSLLPVNPNSNCVVSGISFVILRFKDLTKRDPCLPWYGNTNKWRLFLLSVFVTLLFLPWMFFYLLFCTSYLFCKYLFYNSK